MIDGHEFERRLFIWLDGELPPREAAEMEAYCDAHPDAKARVAAERAFDARVKRALLSDAAGRELVLAALAKAQSAGPSAKRPTEASPASSRPISNGAGRRFALPRWATGVAAAALLAVGAMWINCIPPFECGYLQAMEIAAAAEASGPSVCDGQQGECVPASLTGCCDVWRSNVPVADGDATLLFCPAPGHEPSFRRLRRIEGERWWVGFEDGRTIVAFLDVLGRGLWCFVGTQDEETLVAAAKRYRAELARAAKSPK